MRKYFVLFLIFTSTCVRAQSFEEFRKQAQNDFLALRQQSKENYSNLRQQANAEYSNRMRNSWKELMGLPAEPVPEEKQVPPVVVPEERPIPQHEDTEPAIVPMEIPEPTPITPSPSPEPIEPIVPSPEPTNRDVCINFYGTLAKIRIPLSGFPSLKGISEDDVADMWDILMDEKYDAMLYDCIEWRDDHDLPDWDYVSFTKQLSDLLCSRDNDKIVLQLYILAQTGYDVIPARDENNKLHILVRTNFNLFDYNCWDINGYRYYLTTKEDIHKLHIYDGHFENSNPARMNIQSYPELSLAPSNTRILTSKRYPQLSVTISSNLNVVKQLEEYPILYIEGNPRSRWVFYADTPLDSRTRDLLYPQLRAAITGKTEQEAVEMLLNFVQTAFDYEYDDVIWGEDRAFYSQESLYYPYCDCEDRSILLSRLVRDLLGLDVVLVHYPGHLATAIKFNSTVAGDAFIVDGERYVVCDPTFINAYVGETMTGMNNNEAVIVRL